MTSSRSAVFAASFLAFGADTHASLAPRTDDVLVSTNTGGTRGSPAIVAVSSGRFLVVWEDARPQVEGAHVMGRAFDQDGALVGTEFQIDTAGSAVARAPSIVPAGGGQFVVAWRSDAQNGQRPRILARRIDGDGATVGTEFQINTPRVLDGDYYLGDPATTPAPDGGFVVVWSSGVLQQGPGSYGPASEIYSRRLLPNDDLFFPDQLVSNAGAGGTPSEIRPDVSTRDDGSFVVVWAQGYYSGVGASFQVAARDLHQSGQPSKAEFLVGAAGERGPRVAVREPAGFSVAWSTFQSVDYVPQFGGDVVARTFDAADRPLADRFPVSSPAVGLDPRGDPLRPRAGINGVAAATGSAGEFVVAWTSGPYSGDAAYYGGSSDGDESGIFARAFERDDTPSGRERQANAGGTHDQNRPDLAFTDGDTLAVVWDSEETGDFAPEAIYARVFDLITPACGDADEDGAGAASDALFVLQAAVGARSCAACLCDVNDSGRQTAADALIVLQAAVGTEIELACPPCQEAAVRFALQSDATCWGAHVEMSPASLPSDIAERCSADPSLALLGCSASLSSDGETLVFDARGCFLDPADLFSCTVSEADAAAMAQASSTACGCGCADACAITPVLCAQTGAEPACAAPATLLAREANASPLDRGDGGSAAITSTSAPTSSENVNAAQSTVTSSTTCGTCCDFSDGVSARLESDTVVTELVFRFASNRDPSCAEDVTCTPAAELTGPGYERFTEDGNTVEVCISDAEGIDGPGVAAACDVLTGFITRGPAEVVRALGADLAPITPAPSVVIANER